nr:hypothetical protein [Fusobacterium gastrosuis]
MIKTMEILEKVKEILKKDFEDVSISFLEDEIFDSPILNIISIEPANESYRSVGLGNFAEKEIDNIVFNVHLIRKEEFDGDKSLETFVNDKDKIIELLYCEDLLGVYGDFRSLKIETEALKFTDDEVAFDVWIYRIKVFGEIR